MLRLSGQMAASERMPRNLEPMLATPAKALPPDDDGWGYEIKWDGIRARAYVAEGRVRLAARRGDRPHAPLPGARGDRRRARRPRGDPRRRDRRLRRGRPAELSAPAAAHGADHRVDDPRCAPPRRRRPTSPSTSCGWTARSLLAEPYERRRELLAGLGFDGPNWQAPGAPRRRRRRASGRRSGRRAWRASSPSGCESPYRPGQRSREWLKVRYRRGQELVIGGWMPGEGSRGGRVGSLLVGHWDATPEEAESLGRPQRLVYAGGVGTGFTQEMLDRLNALLEPLARATTRRSSSARTPRSSTASAPATAAPGRSGSSRSSSASSSSPSGPARAPCASRRSRACATTRTRARSSEG